MPQLVDVPGHGVVEFPDGMSDDQIASAIKANMQPQSAPSDPGIMGDLKNAAGGFARSGMGVVSNLMRPIDELIGNNPAPTTSDLITGKKPLSAHEQRMERINQRFQNQGYDPNSLAFKGGKFAGDVAVTAPVGGMLGKGVEAVSQAPKALQLANALRTGGMASGAPLLTRMAAGGATGGAMAGITNPDEAGTGAALGAILPGGVVAGQMVGDKVVKPIARKLMQSAIKPTIKQLEKGQAQTAIDTLLKYGISPTEKGVEKLRGIVDDLNSQISDKIASSNAVVNKSDVLNYLNDPAKRFANQVSPTSDLNSIVGVAQDFINHPGFPGKVIPVQAAQALKQGTYKALKGKYGEVGSAATEAQKALARGLKDQIGKAVPDVVPLNAEEQALLDTLKVSERRALMEVNKNPVGLAALANNPVGFAAFMADRSAAFKALMARMINRASQAPQVAGNVMANPAIRAGMIQSNQP